MGKRIPLLLVVIGVAAFLVPPLCGETPTSPGQRDCPSCLSFGVQRFPEKKTASPFSLKALDGNTIALSELKGKPVLLVFWASWCLGCTEEVPLMEKFSVGKRDQLIILTMAIDGEKEKRIQRFVNKYKITLPVLLDAKEKIARTYGVTMVPTVFLINGEGLLIGKIVGQRDWSSSEASSAIKELLDLR